MYGKCSYALFDHCHYGDRQKDLEIVMQSEDCNSKSIFSSCNRKLIINMTSDNTIIYMASKSMDGKLQPTVSIDGAVVKRRTTAQYQIESIGAEGVVFMKKEKEFKLQWTGRNVYITVGADYQNETCGLCGTYNDNKGDDFHTRSDSTETSVVAFTESWIYKSTEVNEDTAVCHKPWDGSEKPCDISGNKIEYAKDKCNLLKQGDGPFSKCQHIVTPETYFQTCMQDTCMCDSCYCDVMAAYAKICMDNGVALTNWRGETAHCSKSFCTLVYFCVGCT